MSTTTEGNTMGTNREEAERGKQMIEDGRKVKARDLKEGDEVLGVGVMEADAEPLGSTHVRLHIGEQAYDKPADLSVTVGS